MFASHSSRPDTPATLGVGVTPGVDATLTGFLQATLDSLASHIAILNEDGKIISVNAPWKRFAQTNGFEAGLFGLGANYLGVCAEATGSDADEAPEVLAGLQSVLSGQSDEFYLEYPCHGPDEQRWFSLRATRFWGAADAPVRVVVTHENITARKVAEMRLRQESEIIETLYHVGQVVAAELNGDTVITTVTKAALELTGAHYAAFLPQLEPDVGQPYVYGLGGALPDLARALAERSLDAFLPPGKLALSSVTLASTDWREGRIVSPFGAAPLGSYLAEVVMSRDGERLGAIFLGHPDVLAFTDPQTRLLRGLTSQAGLALEHARLYVMQQREKDAAAASEQRYRFVCDLIPQIVWMTDTQGDHEFFNQRWYDYTGQSEEVSHGKGWATPLHPEDVERSRRRWQHSLETGEPYEIEYRFQRYDGLYRWFLGRALPLRDDAGHIIKWFGSCTDIDDSKRADVERAASLEREAIARRDAEAANRIKDEFLAVVSHELRTPLTPILGWMEMLRDDDDNDAAFRHQAYDVIERNARAQSQIINDLLDVSRIITGKLKLDMRPIDMVRVVESAVETVEPAARAKGVHLECHLTRQPGSSIGDDDRLRQVVWNLVSNAVKFTRRGGRVEIKLRRDDSAYLIEVSDTGPGIEREFLPFVFERFRQADASSTRTHGGLGLGLSIVKYLVEQHGGTASVDSEGLGHGSTFRVRLPIAPVSPSEEEDSPEGADAAPAFHASRNILDGLQVLVVDDEADAREVLRAVLTKHGAQVQVAGSAAQALEALDSFAPDVLVSDIGMPGEDGYSLIQNVRARPAHLGGKVPALALTAYARAQDRAKALSSGFQNHLSKPVAPAELVVTLGALVGRIESDRKAP